jgi:hypothetical protein
LDVNATYSLALKCGCTLTFFAESHEREGDFEETAITGKGQAALRAAPGAAPHEHD